MNKYKTRTIEKSLNSLIGKCPVIMITGPRQVGKTTLLNHLVATSTEKINYVSLDNLLIRNQAIEDPELFLRNYETPLIIDEFQYAPNLLSYINFTAHSSLIVSGYFLDQSDNNLSGYIFNKELLYVCPNTSNK